MSRNKKKRVFVGLSGGVDSSVAAYLLKKKGYEVIGVFIHSYNVDGCEEEDAEYARRVAAHLGIPFYVFDMREEYFSRVVAYMIDGYRRGETPNPDVMCNREVKFGLFWERARALGADFIATGHYVRLKSVKGLKSKVKNFSLLQAKDGNKDQSYFLWKLTQSDLTHCLFPVGEYTKPEVRAIAKKIGLPTAEKKDSQGICFLGKVKLPEFLKKYIAPKKGNILDTEGNILGEHEGAQFYTIGQRHLNVGDVRPRRDGAVHPAVKKPFYVVEKNVETNTLTVAEGENHPALFRKEIELTDVSFVSEFEGSRSSLPAGRQALGKWDFPTRIFVRVRYRQPLQEAELLVLNTNNKLGLNNLRLVFDKPVKFVAKGQSAVFYSKKGEVLGGGVIK
jgi:tRNA-specific 2-thiouridylase